MIVLGLGLSGGAMAVGWTTNSVALLIGGFWAFLIVFGCVLFHDWHDYDAVVNKPLQGQLRIGIGIYRNDETKDSA